MNDYVPQSREILLACSEIARVRPLSSIPNSAIPPHMAGISPIPTTRDSPPASDRISHLSDPRSNFGYSVNGSPVGIRPAVLLPRSFGDEAPERCRVPDKGLPHGKGQFLDTRSAADEPMKGGLELSSLSWNGELPRFSNEPSQAVMPTIVSATGLELITGIRAPWISRTLINCAHGAVPPRS